MPLTAEELSWLERALDAVPQGDVVLRIHDHRIVGVDLHIQRRLGKPVQVGVDGEGVDGVVS